MERLRALAQEAIQAGVFPGCVLGVIYDDREEVIAVGAQTYAPDSVRIERDSVYDCASVTKSVVTATLALQLIEKGIWSLEDRLIQYLPEYMGGYRDDITLKHLLTYSVAGPRLSFLATLSALALMDSVLHMQPPYPPGTRFAYSNVPAFLLGLALEKEVGMLDRAAQASIFKPLRMACSTFSPTNAVPTERGVQNVVHDESARVFARAHRAVGHAGLFSSAPDLLRYCRALLEGEILSHDTVTALARNHIEGIGETGLGFELHQPHFMGRTCLPHTFGKTGFVGTSIVLDRERTRALVILSNRTYPHRPPDTSAINLFRASACDIVFSL